MIWPAGEARRQRRRADLLFLRCETLTARISDLEHERDRLRGELARERQACERVVDNALFAAGAQPMFDPEHARFQPRTVERQAEEAKTAGKAPLSMAEWRQRVETLEQERAERDRRARLVEELKALAAERQAIKPAAAADVAEPS